MAEQDESQVGQNANQAMDAAKTAGGKAGKTVGGAAKKGVSLATRKLRNALKKKAMLLLAKAAILFTKAMIAVVMTIWPILLTILLSVGLYAILDHIMIESRGANQEYDYTNIESMNRYNQTRNEYGDMQIQSLSEQNAFLQIFYENEADSSYWLYYEDGDDVVLDFAGSEEVKNEEVVDKYGREKFFQLTAMNLYALDEWLNDNQAISPNTFIQPVPFVIGDDGLLEFRSLTDEQGNIQVKSQLHEHHGENEEGLPTYRRVYDDDDNPVLTEGIWDYGFAPVYHYESYTEEREFRSSITGGEVWDIEDQRMRPMNPEELHEFAENGRLETYGEWMKEFELEEGQNMVHGDASDVPLTESIPDVDVWMIRDAVTPMGIIRNEIEQTWQSTNDIRNDTHTIMKNVPIEKERDVQDTDEDGNKLWYAMRDEARYVRQRIPLNQTGLDGPRPIRDVDPSITHYRWGFVPTGFPALPASPDQTDEVMKNVPTGWTIDWRQVETTDITTKPGADAQIVWTTETYYELVEQAHSVQTQGMMWEYIPRYVSEPDTSELGGLDYYTDYFESYKNYVTRAAIDISPMDYLDRALLEEKEGIEGKDGMLPQYGIPPTLEERREGVTAHPLPEHPLMKSVRDLQLEHLDATSRAHVDLSDIEFGAEADSEAIQNATEYMSEFVEYGNRYGVDPMILIALAAAESNGRHFANTGELQTSGVRRSYTYPEKNLAGNLIGTGESNTAAIGIMQVRPMNGGVASRARTVSAFNQETGQMETFNATASELHDPVTNIRFAAMLTASEARIANHDVLLSMASYHYGARFTQFVRNNGYNTWSPEAAQAYIDSGQDGTASYIQGVLKYYLPLEDSPYPWVLDEDGNRVSQNVEGVEFASGDAINIDVANSVARQRRGTPGSLRRGVDFLVESLPSWSDLPTFRYLSKAAGWIADGARIFTDFVGWTSSTDTTDYYLISNGLSRTEAITLTYTMLAYEEGMYLADYEEMDEEEFTERFVNSFMQHVRQQDRTGMRINPLEFFPDGHEKPVKSATITSEYGARTQTDAHQAGIQLSVPGSTRIYAVANGVIQSIGEHSVVINHGNGVLTHYSHMGSVEVTGSEGDEVKQGWTIGRGAVNGSDGIERDSFFFQLEKGRFMDPTWIVDPTVISGGNMGVDLSAGDFQHPYYGQDESSYTNTSGWGWRIHPVTGRRSFHAGLDIAPMGSVNLPIGALADGVVVNNQYHESWGHLISLYHPNIQGTNGKRVYTLYAHLTSPPPLSVGQEVGRGDFVGSTGTSGRSTGVHLHLEIIEMHGTNPMLRNGQTETVDPVPFIQ